MHATMPTPPSAAATHAGLRAWFVDKYGHDAQLSAADVRTLSSSLDVVAGGPRHVRMSAGELFAVRVMLDLAADVDADPRVHEAVRAVHAEEDDVVDAGADDDAGWPVLLLLPELATAA